MVNIGKAQIKGVGRDVFRLIYKLKYVNTYMIFLYWNGHTIKPWQLQQ
jgi:hypothetical protein